MRQVLLSAPEIKEWKKERKEGKMEERKEGRKGGRQAKANQVICPK